MTEVLAKLGRDSALSFLDTQGLHLRYSYEVPLRGQRGLAPYLGPLWALHVFVTNNKFNKQEEWDARDVHTIAIYCSVLVLIILSESKYIVMEAL